MFFREIANQFPDDCWIGCAYLDGRPVAGGCGFRFGDEFEMTWASSLREYNREAPNMLIYWSFMERAIAEGVKRFNFGRCTRGAGTHRFKMQWGGREEELWWYGLAASNGVTTPSPKDGLVSMGRGFGGDSRFARDQNGAVDRPLSVTWRATASFFHAYPIRALVDRMGAAVTRTQVRSTPVAAVLRRRYGAAEALLTDSGTSTLILVLRKFCHPAEQSHFPPTPASISLRRLSELKPGCGSTTSILRR
jgi:hypothetical protein